MLFVALLLLSLCSCMASSSRWEIQSIEAGHPYFSATRLRYQPEDFLTGLSLEFVSVDHHLLSYLSSKAQPLGRAENVKVWIRIGDQVWEEEIPLHQGNMRAQLPDSWTELTSQALKEGLSLSIGIGDRVQNYHPEACRPFFQQIEARL